MAVHQAIGRVLAQPIQSSQDLPPFDNSSMDGYAVRSQDIAKASPENPVILHVIQNIPAGTVPQLNNGEKQASRIMTGAAIPTGVDAVVPIEDTQTQGDGDQVMINLPASAGQYIRPRGQDIHSGISVLPAGKELTSRDLGLIASLGYATVKVFSVPRVAIFSSGDELIEPGRPLGPGQIYNANQAMLTAMLEEAGADVIQLGTARDTLENIEEHLSAAVSSQAQLILSSAGVSVGEFDYVRQAITNNGTLDFWRVNMRPGKPVAFGSYRGIPFLGLPGNPVSAFVGCMVFAQPILTKLRGGDPFRRSYLQARLLEAVESDGRESYLRCLAGYHQGDLAVRLTGHQGSANLFALSQANALLILPSGVKSLPAGTVASIWLLGNIANEI